MPDDKIANPDLVKDMMDEETGRRKPTGFSHWVLLLVPVIWSLFQLWITSPLPYSIGIGVLNDTASRSLHLGFAIFLAYLGFPMLKRSPRNYIPAYDWVLAFVAAFCAVYLYIFQNELARRPGIPTREDIIVACVGMLLLLEATRRVMGLPMTCVATVFIAYVFLGNSPFVPDIIAHRGATISRAASQFWLTQEGVFGVPLGVSTSFVFLFVLFGAMLERAGAGNYLTALSFALLGHLRGGPAKAAVVASGLHGLISGSSIANVLTCGPVTIMLMKKVGFSAEKAGAVEVAAGSNGQIMPPVMGAAAFLMAEYINLPYAQLIKHAFVPAILAYSSLLYIVHIEACKLGMEGIPRAHRPLGDKLIRWGLSISALLIIMGALYYLTSWIPGVFGGYAWVVFALILAAGYIGMLFLSLKVPELPEDSDELMNLPAALPILFSGLYYLLPIATLVWGLMVLEMSPGLAAYYACLFMAFIILTQRTFVAWFRKKALAPVFKESCHRLFESLSTGGRNMVGIGLATASAGIVVGAVSLTGVGQVLASVVEIVSGGYLPAVLVMTAMLAILLGMGLPTTANYIIVSTLLAPVITDLSAGYGLYIPPLAVHMFCLYFGVMADATPPVALAAFAASGISGGDPFKTGVQGFIYEMRTAVLPFVFIYNQEIILLGIKNVFHFIWVFITAALACMAFASFTQRFMFTKVRWWEMILLFVATVFLFRPDIPHDMMYPPYKELPSAQVMESVAALEPGEDMRLHLVTTFEDGGVKDQVVVLPFKGEGAEERLESAGAWLAWDDKGRLMIDDVMFNSRLEKLKVNMEDPTEVMGIEVVNPRPDKWIFSSPGLLFLGLVVATQIRRSRKEKSLKLELKQASA
ncbi:TRAP transporter permease [Deltaproteobacteria bacterium OttesenSCG-928-K17]|nr:TRAP transporter permease [Deltaproteobacteria bacterium OttesenSCG-928-K17]